MYCNNCGDKGHISKKCSYPVTSYGLLILRGIFEPLELPADPKVLSVLMVRRKDSMSYTEFIRGKYDIEDQEYITRQIENMTISEQNAICKENFDTLWDKMWGSNHETNSEYESAKQKFNTVKKIYKPSEFTEPEWGFPKGRRMKGETDIECAIRETFEETNIPPAAYVLQDNPLIETFVGTNNVEYKHVYFVALLKDSSTFNLSQKFTASQRREISMIGWKSMSECKRIIRPHYRQRKDMITELERIVSLVSK